MHLMDGVLPLSHSGAYAAASAAFVAVGVRNYHKNSLGRLDYRIMSGAFTAFVFTATIFEIPMPFGSSEHPTGTPLAAIFMGPFVTALLSLAVLILELIFREGGITTLGANVLSLGVVGGMAGWLLFHAAKKFRAGLFLAAFLAGFLGDLCVYAVTALQLALGNSGGKSFLLYFLAFVPGQVPLAIIEGVFTGLVISFIHKRRPEFLVKFKVVGEKGGEAG